MTEPTSQPDAGVGLVGTLAGVTGFLALLLLAVQILFSLYASSAVTSVAYDAARVVAGSDSFGAVGFAEDDARDALGEYGDRVQFTWHITDDTVSLRVVARHPSFLPTYLRRPLRMDQLDRTVQIRREVFRG